MVEIFREVKRVLKPTGTCWINLGDSYAGSGVHAEHHANPGKSQAAKRGCKIGTKVTDGLKPKDLIGIPWMVAFALRADGWYLRQDIIWHKPNPMPESVTDRCTKAHEYIFLLSKAKKYYFDSEAIEEVATGFDGRKDTVMKGSNKYKNAVMPGQEPQTLAARGHGRWRFKGTGTFGNRNGELNGLHSGNKYNPKFKNLQPDGQQPNTIHLKRAEGKTDEIYPIRNKRSVWTINTKPYSEAHFATFPELLITDCIKAGCPKDGIVLDIFMGAGTTALVAKKLGRNYLGFELNPKYIQIAEKRLFTELGLFN
jgi:DNA modification methylase